MKLTMAIVLTLQLIPVVSQAQELPLEEAIEEAMRLIRDNISAADLTKDNPAGSVRETFTITLPRTSSSCILTVHRAEEYTIQGRTGSSREVVRLLLDDLTDPTIQSVPESEIELMHYAPGSGRLILRTRGSLLVTFSATDRPASQKLTTFYSILLPPTAAARLQSAFARAITLCGGGG